MLNRLLTDDVILLLHELSQVGTVDFVVEDQLKFVLWADVVHHALLLAPVLWGGEQGINRETQCVLYHGWNQAGQQRTAKLQARIRVHLYQVGLEVIVKHEIVSIDLECIDSSLRVDLTIDSSECISNKFLKCLEFYNYTYFHLREEITFEANVEVRVILI